MCRIETDCNPCVKESADLSDYTKVDLYLCVGFGTDCNPCYKESADPSDYTEVDIYLCVGLKQTVILVSRNLGLLRLF